ncbi:DUF3885 domain-containing protein [Paenibacillus sp. 481]|uniref:DUF3885 domain-containing protein n=1 Tax=Paenibacillus sp. 481 TaxID=2835869 RepID=UPI001E2827AF|nr:DUF3885 domain-containing protein [Paenibacillus sp. 481]UHA71929.1 DUF3885 domain-containing protein [Paenibacillus sp. 481]
MELSLDLYLKEYFKDLEIQSPLFYNAQYGIRFEIGADEDRGYMETVYYRSLNIFNEIFSDTTDFWLYVKSYQHVEPYQLFNEGVDIFKTFLLDNSRFHKINLFRVDEHFDEDTHELTGYVHHFSLKNNKQSLDYIELLKAIGNQDYTIDPYVSDGVFFVEPQKHIIYYLYDDRGLDVISNNRESLLPLYKKFNHWILDYDREKIDRLFQK